ncbi:7937_t:CDS:2 [Cetraspora pellucida]|uniref:7937_t:CDS:1 n=1 Tax=Cetraspora pellucida TaxID=1433469 RepID=A0A9N9E7X0_9GLOM|nr:7937_t:CDS:2 [Cetraspora pellucida]
MSSTNTGTLPTLTIDTDVSVNHNTACPLIPNQPLNSPKFESTRRKKKNRITAKLSRLKSKSISSNSSSADEQGEDYTLFCCCSINVLSRTIPASVKSTASPRRIFHRQRKHKSKNKHNFINRPKLRNIMNFDVNKFGVLPSFPVNQASIPTLPVDGFSIQMNLEAIPKYHDYPHLFLFKDIACKDESIRFLIFQISNHVLYYNSVDKIEDQEWCIKHFKTPLDESSNNESLEFDDIEVDQPRFDDISNQGKNKKIQDIRKRQLLDRFRNIEYKKIGLVDNVDIMDNINSESKNDNDPEWKRFEIKINEISFILGAALVEDKSRFLNSIRFFATEKKRPIRDLLKYKGHIMETFSDSEDESIDSEDDDDLRRDKF